MVQEKEIILTENDIIDIPIETMLGREYGNAILATVETKAGTFDMLFSEQGEAFNRTANEKAFEDIEEFFNKRFEPIILNSQQIWAHHFD